MTMRSSHPRKKPQGGWQTYKEKKEAIMKYRSDKGMISLTIPNDQKDKWKKDAVKEGKSLSRYVIDAVEEHYGKSEASDEEKAE